MFTHLGVRRQVERERHRLDILGSKERQDVALEAQIGHLATLSIRTAGRALWAGVSEDAALASDEATERSLASTIDATGMRLLERGRFEVAARG